MSRCPICDSALDTNNGYQSPDVRELCLYCGFSYTFINGLHFMRVQDEIFTWHNYIEADFYRASQAVEHARAALYCV